MSNLASTWCYCDPLSRFWMRNEEKWSLLYRVVDVVGDVLPQVFTPHGDIGDIVY